MLKDQGYKCSICSTEITFSNKPHEKGHIANIDHCHESGEVRAILCRHCNVGLGAFLEKEEYLLNAVEYLRDHHP